MMILKSKKPRKFIMTHRELKTFPMDAFKDRNITVLDLSCNDITYIPYKIKCLQKLKYLNLENNKISQFPKEILSLQNLKLINLKGNPIKDIPDFIKRSFRGTLIMDNNIIESFADVNYNKFGNIGGKLKELNDDIKKIWEHNTSFSKTKVVPNIENDQLTFQKDKDRKGIDIETCVLFVDIRNSVKMNDNHQTQTLTKIYYSFIYSVLKIANEWNGHVRNIIGDRVMIVFDEEYCCLHAINCAGMIMSIANKYISKLVPNDKFDCGIGIHYGTMHIIKVGLTVQGIENNDYKNLVWIGEPANLASRLTDCAGKEINNQPLPHILISEIVLNKIKEIDFTKHFKCVNGRYFRDINFKVYGCNLYLL